MKSIFTYDNNLEIDTITFPEFCNYIFSDLNSLFEPDKKLTYATGQHKLSSYYINTSHNTYLIGH